jgi:glycerol-3-phosphate dehydrogenase
VSFTHTVDLLIVGGGINGAGIARDAAGRGLRVCLVEQSDLAAHTSSASTKLIHGGLRYLEHFEIRLVREALAERERLLGIAPHIVRPMRFVLPHVSELRPRWQIRLGLLLYDHLGGRKRLPPSEPIRLDRDPSGAALKRGFVHGFAYPDCSVDDARLVVLNALDAALRGAVILPRTRLERAHAADDGWRATCLDVNTGRTIEVRARALINAAGCWVEPVRRAMGLKDFRPPRLVQGSHIVVDRLFAGEHAFLLQNPDRRVVFAIPYEDRFTLIGTTDVPFKGDLETVGISPAEISYLCQTVNRFFKESVGPADVRWSFSGVRALQDDEAAEAAQVTRDYDLKLELAAAGTPVITVIGGKITTYRKLAEAALALVRPFVGGSPESWTASAPLPGGDLPDGQMRIALDRFRGRWRFVPPEMLERLARTYGTRTELILGDARCMADLGECFGADLSAAEVSYLRDTEWALTAEDVLWRRTKLGLRIAPADVVRLEAFMAAMPRDLQQRASV